MGTIKKGILGGFSGKVGTVIGANWRGLDVMRSLPKKSNSVPTDLQTEQRLKFGIVMGFLSPVKGIIEKAYGTSQGVKSNFNLATSYHIQEAITGMMPALDIDFPKVIFTKGELLGPSSATAAATAVGEITYQWQNNSNSGLSKDTDKAIAIVFCPAEKKYVILDGAALRSDLILTLEMPAQFAGKNVHSWLGFISSNGKDAATSLYLGEQTVL